ncbi:hypothetical protein S245_068482, partial [Arachis hypogaea]
KVRIFCFSVLMLLLVLHFLAAAAAAARPLEVNTTARTVWTMMHSGPSPGGKGHKSSVNVAS